MPGLIDMHVHIRSADLRRYVENGVTTVRDLASIDAVVQIARAIDRGEVVGPRIGTIHAGAPTSCSSRQTLSTRRPYSGTRKA